MSNCPETHTKDPHAHTHNFVAKSLALVNTAAQDVTHHGVDWTGNLDLVAHTDPSVGIWISTAASLGCEDRCSRIPLSSMVSIAAVASAASHLFAGLYPQIHRRFRIAPRRHTIPDHCRTLLLVGHKDASIVRVDDHRCRNHLGYHQCNCIRRRKAVQTKRRKLAGARSWVFEGRHSVVVGHKPLERLPTRHDSWVRVITVRSPAGHEKEFMIENGLWAVKMSTTLQA